MTFQRVLNRYAFALVVGSAVTFGSLASATAQLDGPDIDPFEEDLAPSEAPPATEGQQITAEEAIKQGIDFYESGDYAKAMEIENTFLTRVSPGAPGPLSMHYFENGEYAKAIQIANFFIARNPNATGPNLILGKSYAAIGENELALQALASATASSEADYERGKIYYAQRNYKAATDEFKKAVRKDAFNPEYLILRGKAQLRLAQQLAQQSQSFLSNPGAEVNEAIASLDRAIELDEQNAEAYIQRSFANSFLGETDKSVEDAQRAVSLASDEVQNSARLGFTYKSRADGEKSGFEKDLGKAIADYNNAIDAFENYLKVHGDPNNQDEELEEDPEAIAPNDVYLSRALTHIALANTIPADDRSTHFQRAIDDCNRALEFELTDVERATALLHRGIAERLMGQNQAAINSFSDAISAAAAANQPFPEASLRRGITYYHLGDLDSAQVDFEQAMLELRADGRANFWLGVTQARRGQFADAIRYYSAALRENSGYKPAYNNRGLAYLRIGRYEQAANDFSTLLKRDPSDTVARSRRDTARQLLASETNSN